MSLPNPQNTIDAQAIATFGSAISQSAVHLFTRQDRAAPEYSEMRTYFLDNKSKLIDLLVHIEGLVA